MTREVKVFCCLVGYVALSCAGIAIISIQATRHFGIGHAIGSIFAFTVIATVWAAYGPGRRLLRWPVACGLLIAAPMSLWQHSHRVIGPIFIAQAAIIGATFCTTLFAWSLGTRLLKPHDNALAPETGVRQYGIRHLLFMMAATAIVLAIGRMLVPLIQGAGEWPVFVFLAFSSCVLCLPLLVSQLALKRTFLPTLLFLGLSVLATLLESSLMSSLKLRGPDFFHFVWINFFTLLPVLLLCVGLRWCGYRLAKKTVSLQ
jgi:hypothetical protein